MNLLPVLSLGFVLGLTHATDADHVAAMSTVVSERKKLASAAWAGTLWGLGHTAMVVLVGGVIVLFRLAVPERVALSLELGVAAMLVLLGGRALLRKPATHTHRVEASPLRSMGIGLVHGLAGSAAVALAVLTDVKSPTLGVAYLGVFGLGTVVGMVLVTTVLAIPFVLASTRLDGFADRLGKLAGLASLALGVGLAYKIGIVDGLFTS